MLLNIERRIHIKPMVYILKVVIQVITQRLPMNGVLMSKEIDNE